VRFLDDSSNLQDSCLNTSISLSYTGTATGV
jgi:hypothetical protein